jgi:uridine phosphorylase
MRREAYPIIEFDPSPDALIEPCRVADAEAIPDRCVLTFFQEVIEGLVSTGRARQVSNVDTAMGPIPIYGIEIKGTSLSVAHPGITGPFVAAILEELIAKGCRTFVACGGAGVLRRDIVRGMVVVVDSAVRDEGTSYHYLAPTREVTAAPDAVARAEAVLRNYGVKYLVGKTWTTDAFFRETRDRIALRESEGCLTVEMEAASFLAVTQFRKVKFAQLLAAGDDVSGTEWDRRLCDERATHREKLFWLAAEVCLSL